MKIRWIFSLSLLSACAVGPDYEAPKSEVASAWASAVTQGPMVTQEALIEWWKVFNDPLLNKYIQKAADYNKDVLASEANVRNARALREVAASSWFPQIGANFFGAKFYFSKEGPFFANAPPGGTTPLNQIMPIYNFIFDAIWELDLFGKTKRGVEAADAQIASAIEQRNDTLLSIMGEIARNYMEIRSNQKMAILIEENIALLEKNAEIVLKNYEEGYANKLDYENIKAQLATAKSQLPDLVANVYKSIYTISILTGEPPETLLPELLPIQPLPKVPDVVAVGVKSDLLRRRPDVRYAERQLAVATANLGVSVANFYPSINLFGFAGVNALKFSNLFKWKAREWAFGGDVNQPVFQGGKLMGNLKAARATRDQYLEKYEQAVLNALNETESYYMSYAQDLKKSQNLKEAANRNRILVKLTCERYTKGLVNLISLLNSEEQLISAEESVLQSETTTLLDLISLFKALGGGWQIKE